METTEILFADEEDARIAVRDALNKIGKTFAELAAEAATGHFSSERACLTWMAVSDLQEYAPN